MLHQSVGAPPGHSSGSRLKLPRRARRRGANQQTAIDMIQMLLRAQQEALSRTGDLARDRGTAFDRQDPRWRGGGIAVV